MVVLVAVFSSASVLLVLSGLVKLRQPASAAGVFAELGIAVPLVEARTAVRLLGSGEVGIGLLGLVSGWSWIGALTGGLFLLFGAVTARAVRRGLSSCGCFGRASAPPSWWHVGGNVVLAVASFVALAGDSPVEVMDAQAWSGMGFVALTGLMAGVGFALFTAGPTTRR